MKNLRSSKILPLSLSFHCLLEIDGLHHYINNSVILNQTNAYGRCYIRTSALRIIATQTFLRQKSCHNRVNEFVSWFY